MSQLASLLLQWNLNYFLLNSNRGTVRTSTSVTFFFLNEPGHACVESCCFFFLYLNSHVGIKFFFLVSFKRLVMAVLSLASLLLVGFVLTSADKVSVCVASGIVCVRVCARHRLSKWISDCVKLNSAPERIKKSSGPTQQQVFKKTVSKLSRLTCVNAHTASSVKNACWHCTRVSLACYITHVK